MVGVCIVTAAFAAAPALALAKRSGRLYEPTLSLKAKVRVVAGARVVRRRQGPDRGGVQAEDTQRCDLKDSF